MLDKNKVLKGNRIREYRKAKGLTVVELANKIGISQGSLSDIENEKTSPSAETLAALIRETDINMAWLIAGEGEMILTPIAPAIAVITRIIKVLYSKQYKADFKLGVESTVVISRYLDKVEKDLGLFPGRLSLSCIGDPQADLPHDAIVRLCVPRGISLDWIYTGEGEMLHSQNVKSSPVNIIFLKEIINTVEGIFQKQDLHLSPKKKAELITLLYDELIGESLKESLLKEKAIKYVRLAL
jgi:transcriptional regulator with XRE-family HTH domain